MPVLLSGACVCRVMERRLAAGCPRCAFSLWRGNCSGVWQHLGQGERDEVDEVSSQLGASQTAVAGEGQ